MTRKAQTAIVVISRRGLKPWLSSKPQEGQRRIPIALTVMETAFPVSP